MSTSRLDLLSRIAAVLLFAFAPVAIPSAKAQTDVSVSVDFRTTLEPYGHWSHHDRWGDVWVPSHETDNWAPYTRGHWVYTDDWGWYWVSAEDEDDWGWVAYHYGRWVYDDNEGWLWIPGKEWAPAWVTWRRGGHSVGWAPQPPDEIFVEIRDNPRYWIFVEPRSLVSTRIWTEVEPGWEHREFLEDTVIVNRSVVVREQGIAVNPGIEPEFVAHEIGKPIPTYEVHPRILAGTTAVKDAVEVRPGERPEQLKQKKEAVRETSNLIEPAKNVEPPKALSADEKGRLGEHPPRAAAAAAPAGQPNEVEQGKREHGKAAEEAKPEQPGKKAEEHGKPEHGKAAEEAKPEPGKKAEEHGKPERGKAVEEAKPEQHGAKADEQGKGTHGKKAAEQGKSEQPGKSAQGREGSL
jgi:uncharacterized protein DUF6600